MTIEETPVRWQLRLFGEYLDRSFDSRPDPRVTFHPDAWQREVLDKIDRDESILVVAPTSAGKTFISFYAMEKVLRQGDSTVILYIAPTKALVTQIAAEVVARFKKDLRSGSCWAIHTRDQRINNPQGCQILITVPEMAAIMLLSPPLAQTWTPRIRRIILDEIHSIGQQEGGAVWEQLLLLAPCPIIGLSATIGKADVFNEVSPPYCDISDVDIPCSVAFLHANNARFPAFNGCPQTPIFAPSKVLLSHAANRPYLQRYLCHAGVQRYSISSPARPSQPRDQIAPVGFGLRIPGLPHPL